MLMQVEQTIRERELFTSASPVVVMVSGGSDSTALAYLIYDLREQGLVGQPAMLHVNHLIRGEAAYDDQHFVESLAALLEIPLFTCEVDIPALARQRGDNLEAIARQERYLAAHEALESLCRHEAVPFVEGRIVTAHTQDDRVENFYMRSIKGTGPGGFRSMLYHNGPIVRPCLDVSRQDLRTYLEDCAASGQPVVRDETGALWREDATNAHTDRFRAFVRHEIVPRAVERNGQLLDTLCRTMNLIADEDDFLQELAGRIYQEYLEWMGDEGSSRSCLIAPAFGKEPLVLQRRCVRALLEALLGQNARIETPTIQAVLNGFAPDGSPVSGYVTNIQGNLAVSANKRGVLVEPMAQFRARRKRI